MARTIETIAFDIPEELRKRQPTMLEDAISNMMEHNNFSHFSEENGVITYRARYALFSMNALKHIQYEIKDNEIRIEAWVRNFFAPFMYLGGEQELSGVINMSQKSELKKLIKSITDYVRSQEKNSEKVLEMYRKAEKK